MKYPLSPAVMAQGIAFVGKTGTGKTTSAKGGIEEVLRQDERARVCILDPIKSDWWGLTSSASGKQPGFPFQILGGPHGHVPLHSTSGKVLGELVGRGDLPLSIIDMAKFPMGGLQKFFSDFAEALMSSMRGVLYLVLEEAHEFAPKERAGVSGENMAVFWAKKLATAGRSKGIRLMVVTQRTQKLHNDLLGSCETLVAHRLKAPADQKPVKDWLKDNCDEETFKTVSASLGKLKKGTAWVCSDETMATEPTPFPPLTTFDNTKSPESDDGVHHVTTAPVDRAKLTAIIGTAIEEAKANDPTELKKRIRELEAEVAKKPAPVAAAVDPVKLEAVRADGFAAGAIAQRQADGRIYAERIEKVRVAVSSAVADAMPALVAVANAPPKPAAVTPRTVSPPQVAVARDARPSAEGLGKGPSALLTALAQLSRRHGAHVFSAAKVGILGGFSPGSSTFREYMRQLVAGGLAHRHSDGFQISPEGDARAGDVPTIPAGLALVDYWAGKVGKGPGAILRAVSAANGRVGAETVAASSGFSVTSSTWREYTRQLRALSLIQGRDTLELGEAFT